MKWKKIIFWAPAVVVALVLGLTSIAVLLVKISPWIRRGILAKVEHSVAESSGAQVAIRDFKLDLSRFGLELFEIIVHGREAQSAPPLLQIERVTVDLKLSSMFQRSVHLQTLVIHHPVVHVFADRFSGSNLPQPKTNPNVGIATLFNLAIQKFLIDGGQIYFNDAKSQLEAEVHNLQLRAQSDRGLDRYHGVLSYGQGKIQYDRYAPVVHELEASFGVTPSMFTLEKLTVVGGQSQIVAHGVVENFTSPAVQGTFDAQFSASDLSRVFNFASLTAGKAHAAGSFAYQSRNNRSFLQNAVLAGDLTSSVLEVRLPTGRTEVRDVRATYRLAGGNAEIQNIGAQVFGGSLNARVTVHDIAGTSHSTLQSHIRDISVEQLQGAAQQYWSPEAHLSGKMSADTCATWGGTLADLVIHSNASLKGALGLNPITGVLHADYVADHEIELRDSYIRTAETSITLDGKVGSRSQLQIALRSSNLHELELLAANVRTAFSGEPPRKLDLYGSASFRGSVTGLVTAPQLQGKLEVRDQRVKETSWKLLRANVDADPSRFSVSNGYLEGATQGKISFSLRASLNEWIYTPGSPINLEISISQIALTDVVRLADLRYSASGSLSGKASVHGSQLHPLGHGEISLGEGKIFSEPVESLDLGFQGDDKGVHASLLVHLLAGTTKAELTLDPQTGKYRGDIQANNIRLERLQAVKQLNSSIVGALSLGAHGYGVISSPQLTLNIRASQLQVQEQRIPELTLEASVHNWLAEIIVNSEVAPTLLAGRGTVEMKPPYIADLHLDSARFSFQPLPALYARGNVGAMRAQTELHASLRGALQNPKHLEAHLEVPVLTVSYEELQLGATNPVRVDYENGVFELKPVSVQGKGVDVQIQATIPVDDPFTADYLLEGSVDLAIAQMLQPDLRCTGQVQFDLNSRKRIAGSDFDGELRILNTSLHSGAIPVGLDKTNGVLKIGRSRVEVKSFQAEAGGGTVTVRGGVTFRPAIQIDFGLSGSNIRLRYPEGVRAILESNLTLIGDKQEATLGGTVEVQRLSLTPDFDPAGLINQFSQEEHSTPPGEVAHRVRLEINLESASQMDVVSTKVSLQGNANLRLVGTAAEPVVLGRATLNGGDLFFGGNRYVMQNGSIDFLNPLRTEPVLNVRAKTKIDHYVISLNLEGPVERLNTTYSSEPPLAPLDIINLIAFGKTTEATGDNPLTAGNLGAQSVLAQGLGNAVSNQVQRFAGLSYFSINPALGGSNQNVGARVVIQHRVTSNLVVTYSTDVTSTQSQSMQLEYRLNSRWSVSGVRDQNGGFGATANYHTLF